MANFSLYSVLYIKRRTNPLRLEFDRQGVRAWRTTVAHIGREGIPVPVRDTAGVTAGACWARGDAAAGACPVR